MGLAGKINNKDISDYLNSYTFTYLFESTIYNFYKLDDEGKKRLFERYDKEFSEMFSMPRAKIIYEEREMNYDLSKIYVGRLNELNSGIELMFRYFFAKRQQYQLICVENDDKGSFEEDDFLNIRDNYAITPITEKQAYISKKEGLQAYLLNFNKVDALSFAYLQLGYVLSMIDEKRTYSNMKPAELYEFSRSVRYLKNFDNSVTKNMDKLINNKRIQEKKIKKYSDFGIQMKAEAFYVNSLINEISGFSDKSDVDKKNVFLCFDKKIWNQLSIEEKDLVVCACNNAVSEMFRCAQCKTVRYDQGKNSYEFGDDSSCVHVGDLSRTSPVTILQRIVYEYSFMKNKENAMKLKPEQVEEILKEIDFAKERFENNCGFSEIKDNEFILCVRKSAIDMLNNIYKYVKSNLVVGKQKIQPSVSKDEFVVDIYNRKGRVK